MKLGRVPEKNFLAYLNENHRELLKGGAGVSYYIKKGN